MKKFISVILCILLLTLFVSCDKEVADEPTDDFSYDISDEEYAESRKLTVAYPTAVPEGITLPESIDPTLLETLNKRLNNQSFCCAMYYCDLESGFTISYNAERLFGAASLVKAPYLIYIFEMIEEGKLSLDQELTYKVKYHKFGGTGSIKNLPDGTKLKLRDIIERICIESDNSGFRMLYNLNDGVFPLLDLHYKAMQEYNAPFISGTYGNVLNAGGVGRMFGEIYRRAKSSDENFVWFVELLKKANVNKFVKGGLPTDANGECLYEVAHKYGEDIKSLNDAAIVYYEDRPYVLVILTDYTGVYTQAFMNRISSDVYKIHKALTAKSN